MSGLSKIKRFKNFSFTEKELLLKIALSGKRCWKINHPMLLPGKTKKKLEKKLLHNIIANHQDLLEYNTFLYNW